MAKTTSAIITLCCETWKTAPNKIRTKNRGSRIISNIVLEIRHKKENNVCM